MKKSFTILKKANRLTSQQTDTNLPRGLRRSPLTVSPLLYHHHFFHPPLSLTTLLLLSLNSHNMEKHPQVCLFLLFCMFIVGAAVEDTVEAVMDQIREGRGKNYCDSKSSKSLSDQIIPHILNLYASRATPQDFEIYAPHATFEDPLMCAHGVRQIKSAFYSLAKVFSESRIVNYSIEENAISPGKTEILIDNKQYYKFLGRDIDMISLIKLHIEDGKILRHEDWWDRKPLWGRETVKTPLVGRIIEATRRASMLSTHALMRFGKDPST